MTDKVNAWYMYYIDKITISMKFNLKPYGDQYVINFYIEGKDDKPIINTTDFKMEYFQDYDIIKIVEKVVEKIEEEDLNEMIKSLNRTVLDMTYDTTNDTAIPRNATELEDYMKHFNYEDYAKIYFDTDISFSNYVINNKPRCLFIPPRSSGKTMALLNLKFTRKDLYKLTKSQGENMIQKIQINEKKKIVTVVFEDDDVKMIKCSDKDEFDPSIGVALCIAAHVFNSKTKFKKFVNSQIEKQNKKKKCTNSSKSEKTK
jgi:hypothetical protein